MSNLAKLVDAFATELGIERELVVDSLRYNSIPQWDSVGHMALVTALENTFDVMFDSDNVIDMNSFEKAKLILAGHGVVFEEI